MPGNDSVIPSISDDLCPLKFDHDCDYQCDHDFLPPPSTSSGWTTMLTLSS